MNDGLPFNMVKTASFEVLMQVASGDPSFGIMARATYDDMMDARFEIFTDSVASLLQFHSEGMFGMKFLNVIHDGWKAKGNHSIAGVSLAFIDHRWDFRHTAVLSTVMPDGHEAKLVADMIKKRSLAVYGVNFMSMAK
ncbi:hypothetical protein BBJ28_00009324 [Nothophytophthora sp. Chile5]|nr:hypothetical protein BBJ28_00009324 [Nothophytophthora sp. Chile5]